MTLKLSFSIGLVAVLVAPLQSWADSPAKPKITVTTTIDIGSVSEGTLTCFLADKAIEFPKGSSISRSDNSNVLTISVGRGESQTQYRLFNTSCIEVIPNKCSGQVRSWDCQP